MKKTLLALLLVMGMGTSVSAHDFTELKVSNLSKSSSSYYSFIIPNTTKNINISCALLNKDGIPVAAGTWYTDNFVTKALIRYEGDDVVSAKCVFN